MGGGKVAAVLLATAVFAAAVGVGTAAAAPDRVKPWAVVPTPRPVPTSALSSVSCSSATSCFAVGKITSRIHDIPLIERWDGISWSISPSRRAGISSALDGISCVDPYFCVAVGYVYDGNDTHALVEQWNGRRWSVVPPAPMQHGDQLASISCVSATICVAVGTFFTSGGFVDALTEVWDGVSWSVKSSPSPALMRNVLLGVSCASSTLCLAVGFATDLDSQVLIEKWDGATWSLMPHPAVSGTSSGLSGVSCPSVSNCTAVGTQFGSQSLTLVEQWNGGTWSVVPSPNPSPVEGIEGNQLSAVSCFASAHCVAVGGYASDAAHSAVTKTLVETWNGTSWSVTPSSNEAHEPVDLLFGASCIAPTGCMAVGEARNRRRRPETLALVNRWPAPAG